MNYERISDVKKEQKKKLDEPPASPVTIVKKKKEEIEDIQNGFTETTTTTVVTSKIKSKAPIAPIAQKISETEVKIQSKELPNPPASTTSVEKSNIIREEIKIISHSTTETEIIVNLKIL